MAYRCKAKKANGLSCKNPPLGESDYCAVHMKKRKTRARVRCACFVFGKVVVVVPARGI